MTTFTGFSLPLNMQSFPLRLDFDSEDSVQLSDTEFSIDRNDGSDSVFNGTGFADTDTDSVPDTGTITRWEQFSEIDGDPIVLMEDFSMTWEDFRDFVDAGDVDAFLSFFFAGDDAINGSSLNDVLRAFNGNDTMNGLGGKDKLDGGKGKDDIDGGAGKDKLTGGGAQDTLTGGTGADSFLFAKAKDTGVGTTKHDIVADYGSTQGDVIDLRKMNDDDNFHLGGDTFDGEAGEIIGFSAGPSEFIVQGDLNGDAIPDFEILLSGDLLFEELTINF